MKASVLSMLRPVVRALQSLKPETLKPILYYVGKFISVCTLFIGVGLLVVGFQKPILFPIGVLFIIWGLGDLIFNFMGGDEYEE